MSKETELQKIKGALFALGPNLVSDDSKTSAKAATELTKVSSDLKAWASRHGIMLTPHTEDPVPMRKCALLIYPVINGKVQECMLIGQDRRKCLYSCSPATLVPA